MQKIKYINSNGESLDFGVTPPLILQRIEGTGNVDANIQSQKSPFQDGRTYINSKLEPRELFIQSTVYTNNSKELFEIRQEVQRIFNPKLGEGRLEYNTANGTKYINAVPDGTPIFSAYNGDNVVCQITLLCFDPFWYDLESEEYSFSAPYIPMFEFPFFSDSTSELEFGMEQEEITVVNNGTIYTPLIIEFHGGIKNATLTNLTTGEFISIKKELLEDEILTVNTSSGKREIKLQKVDGTEENGFKYLSINSKFLQLEEGTNDIEYKADADSNVTVKLKWINRYLGL